jgi:DEAD/DEAH box helicase domain-containing protein
LAVLVATEDALDQYFMREPDKLLGRRVEAAILDHANPRVLAGHVRAAAYEAPIDDADSAVLGEEAIVAASADPELRRTARGFVWAGRTTPAARIPLRSADPESFTVVDGSTGSLLGHVERSRVYSTVHPGAVYLHGGESFLVRELDEPTLHAVVEPFRGDWYTQPKRETETAVLGPLRREPRAGLDLIFGEVEVTDRVVGYERRTIASQERIELVPLDCPPQAFATEAIWFCPEPAQLEELDTMPKLLATLHAAEHALIAMLPLWAMCDRWDIGGLSTNLHPDTGRPTVFVYDGHPGGIGIAERGFEQFEGWVADTARMVAACPCTDGCPSCIQSPKCGNLNEMLDKSGARILLGRLAA